MITHLSINGFKSLKNIKELKLPRLAVLFGPNTAGKSNFLDALQALSRIGTKHTLADALQDPIRGYPIEAFTFPSGGLTELLNQANSQFTLGSRLIVGKDKFEYKVTMGIVPGAGTLTIEDEYLAALTARDALKGNPLIEKVDNQLRIRRRSKPAHPRTEMVGLNHSILSDLRLSGVEYRGIEKCRNELLGWRMYYLDPRLAMRRPATPSETDDIGPLGENIASFLYRLQNENHKYFEAVRRLLTTIIPSIEGLEVDLDKKRGTLDITIRQNGISYSSRIISEGTLRILALCAIANTPKSPHLLAYEEPENGVHPRRIELIAEVLASLALDQDRQIIVTTHSPLFAAMMIKKAKAAPDKVGLLKVSQGHEGTEIQPFEISGPLFQDTEIAKALTDLGEDGIFQGMVLRGMLDE